MCTLLYYVMLIYLEQHLSVAQKYCKMIQHPAEPS